jgi:RND family efflux transporter MFP subunit
MSFQVERASTGSGRFCVVMAASTVIPIVAAVAGCSREEARIPDPRPVRTVTIEDPAEAEPVSFTGQIRAKDQVKLAFRLDGRMIERKVSVGDVVAAGQVVAKLDARDEQNALRSLEAGLASAQAGLTDARLSLGRQRALLKAEATPPARFDSAQGALHTAEAQVESAQAQLRIAQDRLGYTVVCADSPGAVTATGADSGEVVKAGQMIVQVAEHGRLDAVFDVPEHFIRTGPRGSMESEATGQSTSMPC